MLLDKGNILTNPQGRTYVWGQQNRSKQVVEAGTTVNFTYRSDGLRARKQVVGGETIDYVYDGQTVIGEIHKDTSGNVTKKVWYTPGANGYISRTDLDSAGNVTNKEWFVYDGLGSCRAMVKPNAQGTEAVITARMDYDVYGKVRTQSGSTENKFKYVASIGHPTDEETGLIYMRARYYDPQAGRFVSEDPGQSTINWYWYADGNPTNAVDIDGKEASRVILALLVSIIVKAVIQIGLLALFAVLPGLGTLPAFMISGAISGMISGMVSQYIMTGGVTWKGAAIGGIIGLAGGAVMGAIMRQIAMMVEMLVDEAWDAAALSLAPMVGLPD